MLFNSNIFLFLFLPVVFAGFMILVRASHLAFAQLWLATASLIFYAWADWRLTPLLLLSIAVNFACGRRLSRLNQSGENVRPLLVLGVGFDLLLLAYFKYGVFLDQNVRAVSGLELGLHDIVLPVGISFYTFTQIAFLVDAARGEAKEFDWRRYLLFVTFFPHLIAGPIIHHREMMPQFAQLAARREAMIRNLAAGILPLSIGLFKKLLIADPLGSFANPIFLRAESGQDLHFFIAWAGVLAYSLQIYFDFSAYSDMAVGLARFFGVRFPANFYSPYKARSIIDFWRRWHMTLSRFLRDYVYIPLGGNRHGPLRRYLNLFAVMLIGGLWHGASWTFVIWGGLHGALLTINHLWRDIRSRDGVPRVLSRMAAHLSWPLTMCAVVLAWVVFRAKTLVGATNLYAAMFLSTGLSLPVELERPVAFLLPSSLRGGIYFFAENSREQFYTGLAVVFLAATIALFAPNTIQIASLVKPVIDRTLPADSAAGMFERVLAPLYRRVAESAFRPMGALVCGVLLFLAVRAINAAVETEFLYFQF